MYDGQFFDTIRDGCQRSAEVVVPLLVDLFKPASVVDVGCGEGWWARTFQGHGVAARGIDGPDTIAMVAPFQPHDLTEPLPELGTFDLAISLEVAEHLPPERAESFVADLCRLAPTVVFSAAIPGQGGTGHVNEQWPAYWARLFEACGYTVSGALRHLIWDDERVENWYRQNLLVASRHPSAHRKLFTGPTAAPVALVHPVLWESRL
jgi:SAM-dependent methyltransferase